MASCKAGKPGTIVAPAAPAEAHEADNADPGEVSELKVQQREQGTGKYGTQKVSPYKAPESKEEKEKKKDWIEIVLMDDDGKPIAGEPYEIKLADGSVASGTLDEKGFARVDGIDPGNSDVTFPRIDKSKWEKKG